MRHRGARARAPPRPTRVASVGRGVAACDAATVTTHEVGIVKRGAGGPRMASSADGPLSAVQVASFERDGVVTVDTPFTPEQIDAAEEAWDWLSPGEDSDPANPAGVSRERTDSPAFIATVSHPYLENAAKQLLRSRFVQLQETFPHERGPSAPPAEGEQWPSWSELWSSGAHVDVQMTASDFDATPRREQLVMWLWLTEVTAENGAMRVLMGSHRPIQRHWERVLKPERLRILPRTHGLTPCPKPGGRTSGSRGTEGIPELSDTPWFEQRPTPQVARRGQMLIMTGSVLHCTKAMHNSLPLQQHAKCGLLWCES